MKIYILYYQGFCEFETVITAMLFKGDYTTIALKEGIYLSEEGQKFIPDQTLGEVDPKDVDLFFVPGGDINALIENEQLKSFIRQLDRCRTYVAGICAGAFLMGHYGLLDNRKCTGGSNGLAMEGHDFPNAKICDHMDVVVDDHIITAQGRAYVELAFKIAELFNRYENQTDKQNDFKWFKNIN